MKQSCSSGGTLIETYTNAFTTEESVISEIDSIGFEDLAFKIPGLDSGWSVPRT
jgi:hypothetical protein